MKSILTGNGAPSEMLKETFSSLKISCNGKAQTNSSKPQIILNLQMPSRDLLAGLSYALDMWQEIELN